VIGLFFEQPEGGPIVKIGPVNAATLEVVTQGFDGTQELALFHGECAHGKVDRGALRKQEQRFEQGQGVLTAG
jgi:hypothetical protein